LLSRWAGGEIFCIFGGREWAGKLPIGKSESEQARRDELFKQFDPNGNGYLSLAEVDKGVHDILGREARMSLCCHFLQWDAGD
jgi:hypothetical protein